MGKSIKISPKHGLNPTIVVCEICGAELGVAILGKLKGDVEAPKYSPQGLCDNCKKVIDSGGVLLLEVTDDSKEGNINRTGRVLGMSADYKTRNNINSSIAYMTQSIFSELFKLSEIPQDI